MAKQISLFKCFGVKEATKRPAAATEREAKKKYEAKRTRGFVESWQDNRPWLKYDVANDVL